jgi:hypothetical protein
MTLSIIRSAPSTMLTLRGINAANADTMAAKRADTRQCAAARSGRSFADTDAPKHERMCVRQWPGAGSYHPCSGVRRARPDQPMQNDQMFQQQQQQQQMITT